MISSLRHYEGLGCHQDTVASTKQCQAYTECGQESEDCVEYHHLTPLALTQTSWTPRNEEAQQRLDDVPGNPFDSRQKDRSCERYQSL